MENLDIISTQTTIQARQNIGGNTANFSWSKNEADEITAVNFNVQRGQPGQPEFTGNQVITGAYYPQNQKFDVQNNNVQDGDFALYAEILATCKEIVTPQEEV